MTHDQANILSYPHNHTRYITYILPQWPLSLQIHHTYYVIHTTLVYQTVSIVNAPCGKQGAYMSRSGRGKHIALDPSPSFIQSAAGHSRWPSPLYTSHMPLGQHSLTYAPTSDSVLRAPHPPTRSGQQGSAGRQPMPSGKT